MTRVLLATRNPAKLAELRRILAGITVDPVALEIVGLDDTPGYAEVPETGETFAANALLKAREGARRTGLLCVADDSGLTVQALNGMPGVLSARWAGPPRDDRRNLSLVLHQLADVPSERRGAAFVCAAAAVSPDGREHVVEGLLGGTLAPEPRGEGGFGYDPIFVPTGSSRTTAELSPVEKDAISHRGQAMRALAPLIGRLLHVAPTSVGYAP